MIPLKYLTRLIVPVNHGLIKQMPKVIKISCHDADTKKKLRDHPWHKFNTDNFPMYSLSALRDKCPDFFPLIKTDRSTC